FTRHASGEIFFERAATEDTLPFPEIIIDLLPDLIQVGRHRHPKTTGGKTAARFEMHIITGRRRFLASFVQIGAHVRLIRRLFLREADVAVNAEGTVFGLEGRDLRIDLRESFDHLLCKALDILFCIQVSRLIFFEPRLVIILLKIFQEFERGGFRHGYFILPQFSPLLMRYIVISLTLYFSASFLIVSCRFLLESVFLMVFTCDAVNFSPTVRLACTFLLAILAGLFCW